MVNNEDTESRPLHAYVRKSYDDICRVYWGSHGCELDRGHEGDCICDCSWVPAENGGVGKPPYYGPDTRFYGEDVESRGLPGLAESR